ncbi:regulatory protein RecX [Microbacterium lacticum]
MSREHGGEESLAPVTPLFGPRPARGAGGPEPTAAAADPGATAGWSNTWGAPADPPIDDSTDQPEDIAAVAAAGEAALLRKLRTRSLSVREARAVLAQHGVDDDAVETIVERFVGHGYLDDVKLAEQLVHTGVERKGQGRGVIAQTLSKRGIPREVVDAALEELPGDEFDRALEFARSKARSMRDLDRDTALRRLTGQLARRGYGGVAMSSARQALDEASRPTSRGVRFE